MIKPEVNLQAFILKYDLRESIENCRCCGKEVEVNIPVISRDFVGLESQSHECGEGYRISILRPRAKSIEEWENE